MARRLAGTAILLSEEHSHSPVPTFWFPALPLDSLWREGDILMAPDMLMGPVGEPRYTYVWRGNEVIF